MTIASTLTQWQYDGNDAATAYSYNAKISSATDLVVALIDSDGNYSTQVYRTDYNVTGVGADGGGLVIFNTPPPVGTKNVDIRSSTPVTQPTSIKNQGPFLPEIHEDAFDRITRIVQEVIRKAYTYGIHGPDTEQTPWPALGTAAARANTNIGFDSVGLPALFTVLQSDVLSRELIAGYLTPQTTLEAAALIEPSDDGYQPYDVRRYGVAGDGVTDDTAALNALGAGTWTSDVSFFFPHWMRCKTTDTVTFANTHTVLCMEGMARIQYYGPKDRTALVIGSATSNYASTRMRVSAEYVTLDNDFSNANFKAIQFQGTINGCTIELPFLRGCTTGVEWYCNNDFGMAYNHIFCGLSYDAKYHFLVRGITSNGFWNENQIYGGNHQTTSGGGLQPTDTAYGTILTADPGGYTGHNNNVWHKPCYQLAQSGVSVNRIPIWLNNAGGSNQFRSVRAESIYNEIMKITADTVSVRMNSLDIGYMGNGAGNITAFITETDGGLSYGNRATLNGVPLSSTYNSGNLHAKAWAPDTGKISCEGMFFQASGSGTETTTGTGKIGKDYIILHSAPMGCYIDTTYHKEMRLVADTQTTRGGRVFFTAHDQYGAQITRARAVYFGGAQEDANYGGKRYFQSSDGTASMDFRVDSDVASVKVFFANGTNPCNLRQFSVTGYATQLQANIVVVPTAANVGGGLFGGPFAAPAQRLSTTDPTALGGGYTPRGTTVGYTAAAAGATKTGFLSTLGGWNAIAYAGTAFFLNEMCNNDTGKIYYVTAVSGAGAGAGGPTGAGAGDITDGGVTWRHVGSPTGLNDTWSALPNQNAA